ncbi:serine/threonine protein kinase [Streptomyces sp. NPDC006339]|uniref:serine/threonine protein kinase n=1 Tax=Streptomyces sp. NPDC006339 TaxID=3156755 RepID=UPI0033BDC63F
MERPRPYRLITRLDPPGSAPSPPYRRFVAREVAREAAGESYGDRTVLLTLPLPGTDPALFLHEAEAARRFPAPWTLPVTEVVEAVEVADGAGGPAFAGPYVPALPLPVALAVHGGPLPEETVRVIGAALAETLAALHAQGVTHAGVAPAAVLLTADGPRLTCFGAGRATERVDREAQAPERATGGLPRPPGDVYGLGAVLAYAATGHTVPERSELPSALRATVTTCLTRDPADRPAAAALLSALAPPTPHATVLGSAASLLTPGWLPPRVVAALARQSASLLAADLPVVPGTGAGASTAGAPVPGAAVPGAAGQGAPVPGAAGQGAPVPGPSAPGPAGAAPLAAPSSATPATPATPVPPVGPAGPVAGHPYGGAPTSPASPGN